MHFREYKKNKTKQNKNKKQYKLAKTKQLTIYIRFHFINVRSNTVHGEVYSIQQYVIKRIGDLRQVGNFLRVL